MEVTRTWIYDRICKLNNLLSKYGFLKGFQHENFVPRPQDSWIT